MRSHLPGGCRTKRSLVRHVVARGIRTPKKIRHNFFFGEQKKFFGDKKKIWNKKKFLGTKKFWEQKKFLWGAIFFLGALKKLWGRNKYKSKDD
jgi:hypothetical protein